jgi:CRISPR/Cas system-associated endonuclease Cas1
MTIIDLLRQIKKNLANKRLEIAESMIEGRISDFQSYQKHIGIAEGLQQASEIIDATLKNLDEEDA